MVYNSLTEAPRNLKEGMDWLLALKGTDAEANLKAMGAALYDLLADTPVGFKEVPALEKVKPISKKFLEKGELKDYSHVKDLLKRYEQPMNKTDWLWYKRHTSYHPSDYINIIGFFRLNPEKIAKKLGDVVSGCEKFLEDVKIPDQYKSAYSSKATWEASCSKKPEACAAVLAGIAPMLYAGLQSLLDADKSAEKKGPGSKAATHLGEIMKAIGYVKPECREDLTAPDVHKALRGVDKHVVYTLYDISGMWAFY
ncbi:hypothetical protein, conserved [Babesia ovata]|uniref:Uncharacterized protein n=1 Tax=Babesia ovata TaxID=189622 RepID=A0A2H6KE77_9APIC|nr:uncharacterized protein BOVATA_027770 [Babesia ovata]GBE61284.1 hypothetical protein, conserved [Babesia ovata]